MPPISVSTIHSVPFYSRFLYIFSNFYLDYGYVIVGILLAEWVYSKKFRKIWWVVVAVLYLASIYFRRQFGCDFDWKPGCPLYL